MPGVEQDAKSDLLGLIENYAPQEESISIVLSKGDCLFFKNITSYSELKKLHRDAKAWAELFRTTFCKAPEFKEFADMADDAETLQTCYVLSHLSEEPKFSQHDYLSIAKKAGVLFSEIKAKVDLASMNIQIVGFNAGVETAKKKSRTKPPRSA